jgi:hypothetical protein
MTDASASYGVLAQIAALSGNISAFLGKRERAARVGISSPPRVSASHQVSEVFREENVVHPVGHGLFRRRLENQFGDSSDGRLLSSAVLFRACSDGGRTTRVIAIPSAAPGNPRSRL